MNTERLYYRSDALAFDAAVIAHDGDATRVVLDRTAFYPTSGGQPHDTGTLGGARVIDVIDDDARIVHLLDAPLPLGPVHGEVDATRRADFTVQHTAQHLLSALAADCLGWSTVSVHFGDRHSTIEFDTADVTDEHLTALEQWANAAVGEAIPVAVSFEDAATVTGLRKPTDRTGPIRVVTIGDLDRSACGGTHVTSTARLGSILVTGVERLRGRVRVGYLAGGRIPAALRLRNALIHDIASTAGAGEPELVDLIAKRFEQLGQRERQVAALEATVAEYRIRELLREAPTGSGGVRRLVLHPGAESADALRSLARAASAESRVVLIATLGEPATVIVAASPDAGIDAGALLKRALQDVGGRGGGSATSAQGTVPDANALDRIVALLQQG